MATYWENSCSFGLRYVSWYKYLFVSLVFSHLGFWSGNLFLIAPFPDLCLLVPPSAHSTLFLTPFPSLFTSDIKVSRNINFLQGLKEASIANRFLGILTSSDCCFKKVQNVRFWVHYVTIYQHAAFTIKGQHFTPEIKNE